MLFNSLDYVLFMLLAVTLYWVLARADRLRLVLLFLASCRFYMVWNATYIVLILGSTLLDFLCGLAIQGASTPRRRKLWLALSLAGNLGLLGTFKYYNFFAEAFQQTLGLVGVDVSLHTLNVLLPVGISFYTFQTMSYTIDVYRRQIEPTRNLLHFAVFVSYFPQLVAGPIVRARDFLPQLLKRPVADADRFSEGLFLILCGLVKKVAIADYVAVNLVDRVFDNPSAFTSVEVLVALYGYTLQIYCDFSGYTDVARGTAKLMGLELPENFNRPYMATNVADFWRRWHMTLSTWLRDYLYYPLGGSKAGPVRAYVNLWLTMFLIGVWHGAGWTFVFYGVVQATAMVIHRLSVRLTGRKASDVDTTTVRILKIAITFHFVVLSRILFRGSSLDNAGDVASQLFAGGTSVAQVSASVWVVLALGFLAHWTPPRLVQGLRRAFQWAPAPLQGAAMAGVGAVLMLVATSDVVPYIYFQF
ncbi:MAG: alginate O-acetyltransferase [Myxococcales bacterium]